MARSLGIAGVQTRLAYGEHNSVAMMVINKSKPSSMEVL